MKVRLTCLVNGEAVDLLADDYKTLLEVLREDLGLTGTKHGCELGECGACAVLADGEPVLSCLVLAVECEGLAIEKDDLLHDDPVMKFQRYRFASATTCAGVMPKCS